MAPIAHLLAASLLCASATQAQAPTLSYQGEIRSQEAPLTGSVDLQLRLFDAASGGAIR